MTQKVVNVTIKQLDVTQLYKIRGYFNNENCSLSSVKGAYMYELRELLDTVLHNVEAGNLEFKAPDLTI